MRIPITPIMPDCFANLIGGLGNQMFQIATAYAHSRRNNFQLCLPPTVPGWRQTTYWNTNLHACSQYVRAPTSVTNRHAEPFYHYSPIPATADILCGYFQSSKYFLEYRDEIRSLFASPAHIVNAVNEKHGDLVSKHSVAIHVRRGDYLIKQCVDIHVVTSVAYFERAMGEARRLDPSAQFVVFSDDIDWCRSQSVFAGSTFVVEPNECLTMELMSRFSRYIISNSSFSWWATWLGTPTELVLAPNRWFGLKGRQDWQDIYESGWILVETREKAECYIQMEGGLCNQMFQVAALLQHCMRHKYTPRLSGSCVGNPTYWDTWLNAPSRYIGEPLTDVTTWNEASAHYALISPIAQTLSGCFQSSKYFTDISGIIRHMFDPPAALQEEIRHTYEAILSDEVRPRAIVIHVRRGDYLTGPINPTKHGFLTPDYYRRGIAEVRALAGDATAPLLVFSDDLAWCRAQDFFDGAMFVEEPSDVKALWLMSRFQNYVMSNSSFSWWAVWLGSPARCVVAPDRWFGYPGPYDFEDIYEPDWIKIAP